MRKTESINVRLPKPLMEALKRRAAADDEFPAEIVRRAIDAFLKPPRTPMRSD